MNIVIFDISITGHHNEYLLHLLRYLKTQSSIISNKYIFIVHPLFFQRLNHLSFYEDFSDLNIISITDKEAYKTRVKNGKISMWNSILRISLLKRYARISNAKECILLCFDDFFKGLIITSCFKLRIRGIWFHPLSRMPENNYIDVIRKWQKAFFLKIILKLNDILCIYILNDYYTVNELNRIGRKSVFQMLPDPINLSVEMIHKKSSVSRIHNDKSVFLLFGSITKRKGVLVLLDALRNYLAENVVEKSRFLIVGSVPDHFKVELADAIRETLRIRPNIDLKLIDNYIDDSEVASLFESTDYVLLPYKFFYGSSGVLGHAAFFRKPVICTDEGLIADIVKEYRLGYLTEVNPAALGEVISDLVILGARNLESKYEEYINFHTIYNFSYEILNN